RVRIGLHGAPGSALVLELETPKSSRLLVEDRRSRTPSRKPFRLRSFRPSDSCRSANCEQQRAPSNPPPNQPVVRRAFCVCTNFEFPTPLRGTHEVMTQGPKMLWSSASGALVSL